MQIKKDKMEIELNQKPKQAISDNSDPNAIEGEKVVAVKSRNEMLAAMNKNK